MKTEVIKIDPLSPAEEIVKKAARIIRAGGLVVFPTETVYGLGGDGSSPEVVRRIYRIKARGRDKPLARLIGERGELDSIIWKSGHRKLAEKFWPGPLTLIVKWADGSRRGIRFPDHILTRRLIRESAVPLVATSANLSGEPAVTGGGEAREKFSGKVDLVLDGGKTGGKASTVLDLTVFPEKILRFGPISKEELEECLGHPIID